MKDTVEFVEDLPVIDVSVVDVSVNSFHVDQTVVVGDPLAVPSDSELKQIAKDATVALALALPTTEAEYTFFDI